MKPVRELKETVARKRGPHKRTAIVLILLCVSVYSAMVNEFYFTFYFLQVRPNMNWHNQDIEDANTGCPICSCTWVGLALFLSVPPSA